jgi:hypothetical protein
MIEIRMSTSHKEVESFEQKILDRYHHGVQLHCRIYLF